MRIFNNESMWDAENQQWMEMYTIDGFEVDEETYMEQFKVEELATEDESYLCKCCSCDNDDCDEYNCTCNKPDCCEDNEVENGNMMEEDICPVCGETNCDCGECMCDDCRSQRHDDIVHESVGKAFEKIMASEGCPNCIVEALMEMSLEMKRLGWSDHKDYIDQCNC